MGSRRNIPSSYDDRITKRSETIHREQLPHHVLLEEKIASQEAEIERLSKDNRLLASSHVALRQDLVTAKMEADKLKDHIGSIQTEGDIEIRILLDKIAKSEAVIRAAENIKKEVQLARAEARELVNEKMELTAKIQRATVELENFNADVDEIPEMHAKLDGLRQELERLRETFEYEKGLNVRKVEEMKILEKDVIDMVERVECLRAEVLSGDKRGGAAAIPQSIPNNFSYPSMFHENGSFNLQTIHGAVVDETSPCSGGSFSQGRGV